MSGNTISRLAASLGISSIGPYNLLAFTGASLASAAVYYVYRNLGRWLFGEKIISVTDYEDYLSLMYWISKHEYMTSCNHRVRWRKPYPDSSGEDEVDIIGKGSHFFSEDMNLWITPIFNEDKPISGSAIESLELSFWNLATSSVKLEKLLAKIKQDFLARSHRLHFYSPARGGSWKYDAFLTVPDEKSLITSQANLKLDTDLEEFFETEAWYQSTATKYKRGYLLYGAPGTGKTAAWQTQALKYQKQVYRVSLNGLNDQEFQECCAKLPAKGCFLVFNEFDKAVERWITPSTHYEKYVTRGGFLEAIDGATPLPDGTIVILCVNDRDKAIAAFGKDKAGNSLLRPGKIDANIYFGALTIAEACVLFQKYFPKGDIAKFQKAMEGKKFAVSNLVACFIEHKRQAEEAIAAVDSIVQLRE